VQRVEAQRRGQQLLPLRVYELAHEVQLPVDASQHGGVAGEECPGAQGGAREADVDGADHQRVDEQLRHDLQQQRQRSQVAVPEEHIAALRAEADCGQTLRSVGFGLGLLAQFSSVQFVFIYLLNEYGTRTERGINTHSGNSTSSEKRKPSMRLCISKLHSGQLTPKSVHSTP
jgi:hypothetical protein